MAIYEDDTITIDDKQLVIKNYLWPGRPRHIARSDIRGIGVFEMGFWSGRHRLVGMPMGRPRNWFHWDRDRRGKTTAIGLDTGRFIRPTIVPADPTTVAEILQPTPNR